MTDEIETTPAVVEWNPLEEIRPETVPLEASGGRASVTYRRWTGRERLAYEDAITQRMLTTDERDGSDTVKIGTLRLFAASLTIVASSGFPETPDGRPFLSGTRAEREADLLRITDRPTYDEILRTANRIQPLPSQESDAGDPDDDEDGDAGDPSPTPSTPETVDAVVESESPGA
jgi:hypothetical protein